MSPLTNKPPSCEECDAYKWGLGFVRPEGPLTGPICFIGQGPGESEAYTSRPFHPEAPAGSRFGHWINGAGLQRVHCPIGNLVWCWLPKGKRGGSGWGNREPTLAEIRHCWTHHSGPWVWEWAAKAELPPHLEYPILQPVGVPAIKWILDIPWSRGGERYAGTIQLVELPPVEVLSA